MKQGKFKLRKFDNARIKQFFFSVHSLFKNYRMIQYRASIVKGFIKE